MTAAPVFLVGGRLLPRDGYDVDSGYLLRLDGLRGVRADMPPTEALALLRDELLGDFPFANEGATAHALAMVLQSFVRPMIAGPTPLYVVDAPAAGTGKGLLNAAVSIIAQGTPVPAGAMISDESEIEKRITSLLLSGAPFVLLDEAHELKSPALAAALTADVWRGRRLGKSETVCVPNRALWAATANNVRLGGDIPRRVIPIRLDAQVERPETRANFKYAELKLWTRQHRAELLSACLSLIQAWIDAGMPPGERTLGSYESWAATLGGILATAGLAGFLTGSEYLYGEADDESKDWTGLLDQWRKEFGDKAVTAAPVMSLARRLGLLPGLWAGRTGLGAQQRTGYALQKVRDRVFGGFRVRYAGPDGQTHNASYRVEAVPSARWRGGKKHPETPETTEAFPPQGIQEGCLAGVLGQGDGNTRSLAAGVPLLPDHQTPGKHPTGTGSSPTLPGVSGVSGVSSGPLTPQPDGDAPGHTERLTPEHDDSSAGDANDG